MAFPELGIMSTFYAIALVSSFESWQNVIIQTLPRQLGWDHVSNYETKKNKEIDHGGKCYCLFLNNYQTKSYDF